MQPQNKDRGSEDHVTVAASRPWRGWRVITPRPTNVDSRQQMYKDLEKGIFDWRTSQHENKFKNATPGW